MNITKGKTFVPSSANALVINASEGLVEIILPTADAINNYATRTGAVINNIISYTIVGASALNAVRFYQGGDALWSNGAKYIEFVSNVSGTINGQGGIWGFVESVPPFSGNLKIQSGTFELLKSDISKRLFVPLAGLVSQIDIWGYKVAEEKAIFSQGKAAFVGSGYVNHCIGSKGDGKQFLTGVVPNKVIAFLDSSSGVNSGWVGVVDEINADGFYVNFTKVGEGLNSVFNFIAS